MRYDRLITERRGEKTKKFLILHVMVSAFLRNFQKSVKSCQVYDQQTHFPETVLDLDNRNIKNQDFR
jgi:hypothetical protein